MTIEFDLDTVETTEFGVGRETDSGTRFGSIPTSSKVKSALLSMVKKTIENMESTDGKPPTYEPTEKYECVEYLAVPSSSTLGATIRKIHEAENLPIDDARLSAPESITCYFVRLTDNKNRRLTAIRRAIQFKGVLKSRLVELCDDTLKIVSGDMFKLDNDFDLLVDSTYTHIWRPSAFVFLGELMKEILAAVPGNVSAIASDVPFIEFASIEEYAKSHSRAARHLASIRSQSLQGTDREALIRLCDNTGVGVYEANGKIKVNAGDEMGFLEVLDRRRYQIELIHDQPERFKAPSRVRIDGV